MPRRKNAKGRLVIGRNCQLGRIGYKYADHYCDRPAVAKIAGVRLCAEHLRRVEAIEADAKAKRYGGVAA